MSQDQNNEGEKRIVTTSNTRAIQTDKNDSIAVMSGEEGETVENIQVDQKKGNNLGFVSDAKAVVFKQGDEASVGANTLHVVNVADAGFEQGAGPDAAFLSGANREVVLMQGGGDDVATVTIPKAEPKISNNFDVILNGYKGEDTVRVVGKREDYDVTLIDSPANEVDIKRKGQAPDDTSALKIRNYEKIEFVDAVPADAAVSNPINITEAARTLKEMGVKEADETAINAFAFAKTAGPGKEPGR